MVLVIGIHTYMEGWGHFNLFLRQFLNCAVPVFLAVSGYFIGQKDFSGRGQYAAFLKRQLPRVYIPMLLWSVPTVVEALGEGEPPSDVLLTAAVGGVSVFYFVPLIMQYYVLTPAIQLANRRLGGIGYAALLTAAGISAYTYCLTIKGMPLSLVQSAGLFPVWLVFYAVGVLMAQGLLRPMGEKFLLWGAGISILLCCAEIWELWRLSGKWVHGIKLSAHVYSFFVICILFSGFARDWYHRVEAWRLVAWIQELGRMSFFVYLTHMLLLRKINLIPAWSLRWISCVVLAYLVGKLLLRIVPLRYQRYLGF